MSPGLIREISANKIMEGFFLELNLRNKTEFLIVYVMLTGMRPYYMLTSLTSFVLVPKNARH